MFAELGARLDDLESTIREQIAERRLVTSRVRLVGIGRSASNDIVVDKPVVSRRHAQVRSTTDATGRRLEVCDLGSANGCDLVRNGERSALVAGVWVELQPGDEIVTLRDERLFTVAAAEGTT